MDTPLMPRKLREAHRWLVWKEFPNKDPSKKARKVPFYVSGEERGATDTPEDLDQLGTLEHALKVLASGGYAGLGFALGPVDPEDLGGLHYQGVDLDHTDELPHLAALVPELPGYVEDSPSGTGVHALGLGKRFKTLGNNGTGVEAYSFGRFFTFTGRVIRNADLVDLSSCVADTLYPLHSVAKRKPSSLSGAVGALGGGLNPKTPGNVAHMWGALAHLSANCDEWTWRQVVWAIRAHGEEWGDVARQWSMTAPDRWDEDEFDKTWSRWDSSGVGAGTLYHLAEKNGWTNPRKANGTGGHAQVGGDTPEWPDPIPLPIGIPQAPEFEPQLLPEAFRGWVLDIADRMQCPPEYPSVAALVSLASVVGRQMGIRPKSKDDWTVVPNLWGAIIGPPSQLKTPAIQEATKRIDALEVKARTAHEAAEKAHQAAGLVAKAQGKLDEQEIVKAVKAGHNERAKQIAMASLEESPAPARKRYKTQDATVEKLGELLRDNPRGLLVLRDELVGLLKQWDREGNEGTRAFFLEAWNGNGAFTFDRIGRGTVEIEAACVSILGGIQPGPLSDYLSGTIKGGAGDDGLLQRFQLMAWPDPSKSWKNVDRWPDRDCRNTAHGVFEVLDQIDPSQWGAEREADDAIPWVRFTPEAQEFFNSWREKLETLLRSEKLHPALEAHLAKYRSLVPALALLFWLADNAKAPVSGGVDLASTRRAIALSVFLKRHAQKIYHPAIHAEMMGAAALLQRLPTLPDPFTAKDVYKNHWRFLDRTNTLAALDILDDFHWIRGEAVNTGGRPVVRYVKNPRVGREG